MGKCLGKEHEGEADTGGVDFGGSEENTINYDGKQDYRIENKHGDYKGTLIQYRGDAGKKVFRAPISGNKPNEVVTVYSYTWSGTPPVDGTYVVLQFKETKMYFASKKDEPGKLVLRKKRVFNPEDATKITRPDDRRVFLQKSNQKSRDMLYQSVFASEKLESSRVITVFKGKNTAAELEDEVTTEMDPLRDAQLFKMESA